MRSFLKVYISMIIILSLTACSKPIQIAKQEANNASVTTSAATNVRESEYLLSHKTEFINDTITEESYYEYDNERRLKKYVIINHNNNTTSEYLYSYDSLGRILNCTHTTTSKGSSNASVTEKEYVYSEDGRSATVYQATPELGRLPIYKELFDLWGNLIGNSLYGYSVNMYDRYGTEIGEVRLGAMSDGNYQIFTPGVNAIYDEEGDIRAFSGYSDTDGFIMHRYIYDNKGRIMHDYMKQIFDIEKDSIVIRDTIWEYDSNNNYTQKIHLYSLFDEGSENLLFLTEFKSDHKKIKATCVDCSTGNKEYEDYYDTEGELEKNIYYDADGKAHISDEYIRTLDAYGNVIERKHYVENCLQDYTIYEYVFQ